MGGVKIKMGNTQPRQDEAAPAGDAFVQNESFETLFNYGGQATPWESWWWSVTPPPKKKTVCHGL